MHLPFVSALCPSTHRQMRIHMHLHAHPKPWVFLFPPPRLTRKLKEGGGHPFIWIVPCFLHVNFVILFV